MIFPARFLYALRTFSHRSGAILLVTAIVASVVLALGIFLDRQNSAYYDRELHIRTENETALLHARIRSQISMDFSVLRNLANTISADPEQSSEALTDQIDRVLLQNPHFSHLIVAPQFLIRTITPENGSDSRVGDNILMLGSSEDGGLRHTLAPAPNFFGPVAQRNHNGRFVAILPVTVKNGQSRSTWGAIEAEIDEARFYQTVGLLRSRSSESAEWFDPFSRLSIAVRDLMKTDVSAPFFGLPGVLEQSPITKELKFPGGRWEIAAIPREGWDAPPPNQLIFRLIIVLAASIIILPVYFIGMLLKERNRNVAQLEQREGRLLELSQRLNLALDSANIGIWELRDGGADLYWDSRAAQVHGFGPIESWQRLADWSSVLHPADLDLAEAHFFNCECAGTTCTTQYRIIQADGSERYVRSVGSLFANGTERRIAGLVWDVTADALNNETLLRSKESSEIKTAELELALMELLAREHELAELSRRLDLALESYDCGIWEADADTRTSIWDERMHQLYGCPPKNGPVECDEWLACIHPQDRDRVRLLSVNPPLQGERQTSTHRVVLKDGTVRHIRSVGQMHQARDGENKLIGIAFDITADVLLAEQLRTAKTEADMRNAELELTKSRIEHNALHDPLTLLGNRRKLDAALDTLALSSLDKRKSVSLLHMDLDRFKQINDTLGHAAGDAMLVHAAGILRRNTGENDLVARIGGDEFVILVDNTHDGTRVSQLAATIIEEMRQPVDFQGFPCRCGMSIGIAQATGMNIDARKMLVDADIALYQAKGMGRNRYEFFTQNLQAKIINSKRTADEILTGLERNEFTAWYQPQVDAGTLALTGVEALVRWNHPTKGILTPDRFLKIAEELNVVATMDRIVLETALRDKMRWAARGIHVPKVSVNVSAWRLHDAELLDSLKKLPIRPGEISFELVESIFLDESEDVASANLERIKALGIDIEIDDFGTGHTSIVSLLKLRPKRLKIDRQLVKPILESPQERALVRSIIDIARSLGVETVAEGVETMEHAAMLRELGCDLLQGYAFAKPLSFDSFCDVSSAAVWRKAS